MHSGLGRSDLNSQLFEVIVDSLRMEVCLKLVGKGRGGFPLRFVPPALTRLPGIETLEAFFQQFHHTFDPCGLTALPGSWTPQEKRHTGRHFASRCSIFSRIVESCEYDRAGDRWAIAVPGQGTALWTAVI